MDINKNSIVEIILYDKGIIIFDNYYQSIIFLNSNRHFKLSKKIKKRNISAGVEPVVHPFHLHGYKFTVLKIGPQRSQNYTINDIHSILNDHKKVLSTTGYSRHLPMKDTVIIPTAGYVILRFIADNPGRSSHILDFYFYLYTKKLFIYYASFLHTGWWIFHCHIDWHMVEGMNMILHVGERYDLPPVPPNFPKCGSWLPTI